jgi:predicted DNA-binding protein (UPF0251 family)
VRYFKPAGIEMRALEEVTLQLDEIEALRLTDLEGLYQEEAAARMGISRPTLSRISAEARWKVADALVNGKALRVEGGEEMSTGDGRMIEQKEAKREPVSSPEPENGGRGLGRKRRQRRRRRDGTGRGRYKTQPPIQVEVDQRSDDVEESKGSSRRL